MTVPSPKITYRWWDNNPDPSNIVGEGPPLFNVHEVTVSMRRSGVLRAWVRGAMRKKDGTRGPSRGVEVNGYAAQPPWLREVLADASKRLAL